MGRPRKSSLVDTRLADAAVETVTKAHEDALQRVSDRAARYVSESTLKHESTKRDLAYVAAGLFEHYHYLTISAASGYGRAEETRTIPAVASSYKRIMDTLGVTVDRIDDEIDGLL